MYLSELLEWVYLVLIDRNVQQKTYQAHTYVCYICTTYVCSHKYQHSYFILKQNILNISVFYELDSTSSC